MPISIGSGSKTRSRESMRYATDTLDQSIMVPKGRGYLAHSVLGLTGHDVRKSTATDTKLSSHK